MELSRPRNKGAFRRVVRFDCLCTICGPMHFAVQCSMQYAIQCAMRYAVQHAVQFANLGITSEEHQCTGMKEHQCRPWGWAQFAYTQKARQCIVIIMFIIIKLIIIILIIIDIIISWEWEWQGWRHWDWRWWWQDLECMKCSIFYHRAVDQGPRRREGEGVASAVSRLWCWCRWFLFIGDGDDRVKNVWSAAYFTTER